MAEPKPPTAPQPSGSPDRRALLQAFQDVVRSETEKRDHAGEEEPTPHPRYRLTMVAVAVALVGILVVQPSWLVTKPPEQTPQIQDASLRVRMFAEIMRIQRFKSDSGRLPRTLAEAGGDSTNLEYRPSGSAFTLHGHNGALTLTYDSGTPPREFLGTGYTLITQRRKS